LSTLDFSTELAAAGGQRQQPGGRGPFLRAPLSAWRCRRCHYGAFFSWRPPLRPTSPSTTRYRPTRRFHLRNQVRRIGSAAISWGRDVYSRIVYGARISLAVSVGSMLLGCTLGVTLGLLSGYLLGWFDLVTQARFSK